MSKAESLKILLAHKKQSYVVDCGCRRRVVPPIKDRQLCDRAAWAINAEYLFAPVGRDLVYADVSGLNHVKSRARFTFAKYRLSRRVMAGNDTLGQETQLAFRQPGEDGNLRQRLPNFGRGVRHGEYCTRARRPIRICVHLSSRPPWQSRGRCPRPPKAAGGEINCKGGLAMKNVSSNALCGRWEPRQHSMEHI